MKILVILGSPRKNGNSETLAIKTAETIQASLPADIEYLRLHKADISGCTACGGCEKNGTCIIDDDMTEIYGKIDTADIILLASPIYFYGPSSQIKTFIDRFQARWSRKYLKKVRIRSNEQRAGYLLSTAATQGKKLFDGSILIAKSFFDAIDVAYGGACTVRGVDEKGAIANQPEELEKAQSFGRKIVEQWTP